MLKARSGPHPRSPPEIGCEVHLQSALKSGGCSEFKNSRTAVRDGWQCPGLLSRALGLPAVGSVCVSGSGIKQESVSLENSSAAACHARALQGDRKGLLLPGGRKRMGRGYRKGAS